MLIRMTLMTITCLLAFNVGCDERSYNANSDPLGNGEGDHEMYGPAGRSSGELPELPTMADGERAEAEQAESGD